MSYQSLFNHVNQYTSLSHEDELLLIERLGQISLTRKQIILQPGEKCRASYFVTKGCVHSYFIDEKGEEQILQFAIENWWISDYESLLRDKPSDLYIEAIEDGELIELKGADAENLFKEIPQLERYFRIVSQIAYMATILRVKFSYQYSKERLYLNFLADFPEFVQRIPDYKLASYLGFTPEYLSRIRKKHIS